MRASTTQTALMLAAALLGNLAPGAAQPPEIDLSRQQQAIEALSFMVGEWQGESRLHRGPEPEMSQVSERITSRLDGTLLLIEGRGTATGEDGTVDIVHDALAAVWFDEAEGRYRMRTFIPGRTTEADFELSDDGIVWGFETPGGRVRYKATFSQDTWIERGEFSRDGETWTPFLEMTLRRSEGSS